MCAIFLINSSFSECLIINVQKNLNATNTFIFVTVLTLADYMTAIRSSDSSCF